MKFTFLEPPSIDAHVPERFAGCSFELYHFPDLANFFIMAVLAKAGHTVDYIDAVVRHSTHDEFYARLKADDADAYIVHSVILSKKTDLYIARKIRELRPGALIIFHGPEPTRVPEEYVTDERILVFRGEPEDNLLAYFREGARAGMSFWADGKVEHAPPSGRFVDLDALPSPMRDHPALKDYIRSYVNPKFSRAPFTTMMTSRGCRFNCLFCVPISISFARELEHMKYSGKKPPASVAGAPRVIAEFKELHAQGFKSVMIVDDQFLWGKLRTLEICDGIRELGIEWGCLSRADFLTDEEVVAALASAGCRSIDIGVESLSQKILDYINKELRVETVFRALANLKKHGINAKLNIMFGTSPEETEEDIKATVRGLKKVSNGEIMFTIATPFKGTRFYQHCEQKGYLVDSSDDINPLGKSIISYPGLSKEALERLKKYAYRSYYLRPAYLWRRLRSYRRLSDIFRDIGIAFNILK